jgi:hypothetical protein
MADPLYFEAHVTIEPVEGDRWVRFVEIAKKVRFDVATFTKDSTGADSMIGTGKGHDRDALRDRMLDMVTALFNEDFVVTRYKLESTILDSRIDDEVARLGGKPS